MFKLQILDVQDNKVEIKKLSNNEDIFVKDHKRYVKDYSYITFQDLINNYFLDNGNYHIYDVYITSSDDDIYIKINYVYLENKNGYHIVNKDYNVLVVRKELYYNTVLERMIVELSNKINEEKEYKKSFLQAESYEIKDVQDRIMSKSCEYIETYLNHDRNVNIEDFHITKEELSEYIKNNRRFVRTFIHENWDTFKALFGGVLITGAVSASVAMYMLVANKMSLPLEVSTIIYLSTIVSFASLELAAEIKLNHFQNMGKSKRKVRTK